MLSDTQLLAIASSLVAVMFGLLAAILGWLGSKVYTKLEEVASSVGAIKDEMHIKIADVTTDLNKQISGVDKRLAVVETRLNQYSARGKD